jgi:hypothetical protein
MNVYEPYISINKKLVRGDTVLFSQIGGNGSTPSVLRDYDRLLSYPKIGIYTGKGTSHSWLWFVDLFDRFGFYDIALLDEDHIKTDGLHDLDVLAMSGGDTFAIAEGLGEKGAEELESFIRNGGLYVGSCAGAYLPLNSSKTHLNLFNYVDAKIANLTQDVPEARAWSEKFCTPYGCSFIFHPVREAVRLTTNGFIPFKGVESLLAPLYGGPPMVPSDSSHALATYSGFTDKTFFLVDQGLARDTLIGKAAVIRKKMGSGHLDLFGPHFEHPHFPVANQLLANTIYWDVQREGPAAKESDGMKHMVVTGGEAKGLLRDIKREISNSRIVAAGLELMPVSWTIGNKVYEPVKVRVFIEAIWLRIKALERAGRIEVLPGKDALIVQSASEVRVLLRELRRDIDAGINTLNRAKRVFEVLNRACSIFLEMYFMTKLSQFNGENEATV